jgi:hypothetical protein
MSFISVLVVATGVANGVLIVDPPFDWDRVGKLRVNELEKSPALYRV